MKASDWNYLNRLLREHAYFTGGPGTRAKRTPEKERHIDPPEHVPEPLAPPNPNIAHFCTRCRQWKNHCYCKRKRT